MRFRLSSQPTSQTLFDNRRFSVVTAYNPRSQLLEKAENQARHQQLEADVLALGWQSAPSLGSSPSGDWIEHGLLIWDAPLELVLDLARRYGQHAILFAEAGQVALVWCESGELEWFFVLSAD